MIGETTSHTVLARHGLAPRLLARFDNGLLYQYIPGTPCTSHELTTEPIWRGVANRLAQWHSQLPIQSRGKTAVIKNNIQVPLTDANRKMPEALARINAITQLPVPNIWSVMQSWIQALPTGTKSERHMQTVLQNEAEKSAKQLSHVPGLGGNGVSLGFSLVVAEHTLN